MKNLKSNIKVVLLFSLLGCLGDSVAQARKRPTLWIIGDSTVKNSSRTQEGWGSQIGDYFDSRKIKVENRARGGCSSRSFLTEGLWDDVLKEVETGDYVLMQFGHNDGGGKYFDAKGRASIHGTGDETEEGELPNGTSVTVRSYGWYLRRYIADAKEKGARPIVASPIPRNRWGEDEKVFREDKGYGLWAKESATQAQVPFVDLNGIIADHYDKAGAEKVKAFFPDDWTHTNEAGARFNARCVVEGLYTMKSPLRRLMVPSYKMKKLIEKTEL